MAYSSSYRSFFVSSDLLKVSFAMVSKFAEVLPTLAPPVTTLEPPTAGALTPLPADLTLGVRSGTPRSSGTWQGAGSVEAQGQFILSASGLLAGGSASHGTGRGAKHCEETPEDGEHLGKSHAFKNATGGGAAAGGGAADMFCFNFDGVVQKRPGGSSGIFCPGLIGLVSGSPDGDGTGFCNNQSEAKTSTSKSSQKGGHCNQQSETKSSTSKSSQSMQQTHLQKLEFELSQKAYKLYQQKLMQDERQVVQDVEASLLKKEMMDLQKALQTQSEERQKIKSATADLEQREDKMAKERLQLDLKLEKIRSSTADIMSRESKVTKDLEEVAAGRMEVSAGKLQIAAEEKRLSVELQVLAREKHALALERHMLQEKLKASDVDKVSALIAFNSFRSRVMAFRGFVGDWVTIVALLAVIGALLCAKTPKQLFDIGWQVVVNEVVDNKADLQDKFDRAEQDVDLHSRHEIFPSVDAANK